jgi:DNA-binding protein YbaB
MAAYTDATTQVLNTWGQAVVEESEQPRLRPMADVSGSLHARLNEVTEQAVVAERSEEVLTRLADYLADVNDEIDGVTAEAEAVASAVLVGSSRGVEVSVNGMSTLVDVRIEPEKAAGTNGAGIARDVMRAYKDAVRQARTRTVGDVIAASKIGELQRLANDPRALAERFGLA